MQASIYEGISPEFRRILEEVPLTILPPETSSRLTPYSIRLEELSLDKKALRSDNDGKYWRWKKDSAGNKFRTPTSMSMLRSSPYYANLQASEQRKKYLKFRDLIEGDEFLRAYVRIPLQASPTIEDLSQAKEALRDIRKAFKALPGSIDKIGVLGGQLVVKLLCRRAGEGLQASLEKVQVQLPPGAKFSWHNTPKGDFRKVLKDFTSPDLPTTEAGRANFEFIITKVHQVVSHNLSKEERSKFVLEQTPYTNSPSPPPGRSPGICLHCGKAHLKSTPINPATGLQTTHIYAETSLSTVRIIDLKDNLWVELVPWCELEEFPS